MRRRRLCLHCGYRFTTREYAVLPKITVTKRNGSKEPFDKEKLRAGLQKACVRRNISEQDIETFVDELEEELIESGTTEVTSRSLGSQCLEWLGSRDPVAFLRFASVFANFESIDDFLKWTEQLRKEEADQPDQAEAQVEQLPLLESEEEAQ